LKTITIAGNLGRDAETRVLENGTVTNFTVAVSDGFGERASTLWFDCALWGKRGEALAPHLTKGLKVTVSGDLSTHAKDGRTYLKVRAFDITLMGSKPSQTDAKQPSTASPADDEIPF